MGRRGSDHANIFLRQYQSNLTPDTTYNTYQLVSTNTQSGQNAISPRATMRIVGSASDGAFVVVWAQRMGFLNDDVWGNQGTSAGLGTAPFNIITDSGTSDSPVVALDAADSVYVLFYDNTPFSTTVNPEFNNPGTAASPSNGIFFQYLGAQQ